jgi:hypothetical protein
VNFEPAFDQAFLWIAPHVPLTQPLRFPAAHTSTGRIPIHTYI